jgi:hypothetical protein
MATASFIPKFTSPIVLMATAMPSGRLCAVSVTAVQERGFMRVSMQSASQLYKTCESQSEKQASLQINSTKNERVT